jgi:hypothetical protein
MHLLMVITHGGTRMLSWFRRRRGQSDTSAATVSPITSPAAKPTPRPAAAGPAVHVPHDKIEARAYEIWVRKGKPHGQDLQNWAEAEAELRAEFTARPDPEPPPRKPR